MSISKIDADADSSLLAKHVHPQQARLDQIKQMLQQMRSDIERTQNDLAETLQEVTAFYQKYDLPEPTELTVTSVEVE